MSQVIPDSMQDLFRKQAFAHLATVMPDGRPQVTPVWVTLVDGKPAFNTAKGRAKHRNIQARPQVSLAIAPAENPYTYVEVQGTASFREEGAEEMIDTLAQKYIGQERYPWRSPGEERITIVIEPEHISGQ